MTVDVDFEPEVLDAITKIAAERGRSIDEVVSDLVRIGLRLHAESQASNDQERQ